MSGIGIKEVAFVGYPVTDFEKAKAFYGGVLGLEEGAIFEEEGETQWLEFEAGGTTIALGKAGPHWEPGPQGGGACFEVEDLDAAVARLAEAGVDVGPGVLEQPICRLALISDPDGNGIALHQKKTHHPDLQ